MAFRPAEMPVFDRSGKRLGTLTGWSVVAPRNFKFNEPEDFTFSIPRNDGSVPIYSSALSAPTFVAARTGTAAGGTLTLTDPAGTTTGDLLVAHISYNRNWSNGAKVATPAGWTLRRMTGGRVCDWQPGGGGSPGDFAMATFTRFVAAGDPTTRNFVNSAGSGIAGAITAYRGVSSVEATSLAPATGAGTDHRCDAPPAKHNNTLLVFGFGYDRNVTSVAADSSTERADVGRADAAVAVYSRVVAAANNSPAVGHATSSAAAAAVASGLSLAPAPGIDRLLQNDNLVFLASTSPGIPNWAGSISNIHDADGETEVQCIGTADLLNALSSELIEQEELVTGNIARRLVLAANAKQASHGDLEVEFGMADQDKQQFLGRYSYNGNILQGLQSLAEQTISEFYMESWIDADTGRLRTKLHWRKRRSIDHTAALTKSGAPFVLKDGVGANLSPGTEVNFSGSQRANYVRLVGAPTTFGDFINYPAVANVLQDVTPVALVNIPESAMPGARRREKIDLAVPWGLSRERQRTLAQGIEATYLGYYLSFLTAFHHRWGQPFLDGFEWNGPSDSAAEALSSRHKRTYMRLGLVGERSVAFAPPADSDADVTLEGWHRLKTITVSGQRGVAIDFANPALRWVIRDAYSTALGDAILSIRLSDYADRPNTAFSATKGSEDGVDIATDPNEPNTMWVLTWPGGGKSTVRAWDLTVLRPISEWTISQKLSGISVDAAQGILWATVDSTPTVVRLDVNNGVQLASFDCTATMSLVGISTSGGIGYIVGDGGRIEMRHLTQNLKNASDSTTHGYGDYAGSKVLSGPLTGILVDPRNTEIWITTPNETRVFSASIAVDAGSQSGVVDGAPGFPKIASGQFVRIVMVDARDNFGGPSTQPSAALAAGGTVPLPGAGGAPSSAKLNTPYITHVCQFGRYVGGRWTEWGGTHWPGDGTVNYNSSNCTMAAGCMLLDRHTSGRVKKTPPEMRLASNDRVDGSNPDDIAAAWQKFGYTLHYHGWGHGGTWNDVMDKLREGRGVYVAGLYGALPKRYRCEKEGFTGDHAMYIHMIQPNGNLLVHDPICGHRGLQAGVGGKSIPPSVMREYCGALTDFHSNPPRRLGMGKAVYGWSAISSTGGTGNSRSGAYAVWAIGNWKDTYQSNGAGQPTSLIRTWDVGDLHAGFFKKDTIALQAPDQVILGEEGRVNDWDPITQGYGVNGTAFYTTDDGHTVQASGWYLQPWDVSESVFDVGQPDWPEGEAYAADYLSRWNSQQGSQVLGLVNVDGAWDLIERGGLYKISASLQGPYPEGISGTVRVVGFSPDENNGDMQLLSEWVDS